MKTLFADKLARMNPFALVVIIALLVVGGMAFARRRAENAYNPEIVYAERGGRLIKQSGEKKPAVHYNMLDDPNLLTAGRVRDASSLAFVLGLYRVNEFAQKHPTPANVNSMIAGVMNASLLPPGLSVSDRAPGVIISDSSTLYVRYRINPFGVEIVSVPQKPGIGDNVLIRLPSDEVIPNNAASMAASLYTIPYAKELQVPEPFSSRAFIEAQGWKFEQLHESKLTPEQVTQLSQQIKAMSVRGG